MKIKTSELEGAALDWAVARSLGEHIGTDSEWCIGVLYSPSINWSQCGPLIRDHIIMLQHTQGAVIGDACGEWMATATYDDGVCLADTPLIAACRAIVAAKLGDEVEVPSVLVERHG